MRKPRVIVLHREASIESSVPAASKGRARGKFALSTFDEGSAQLNALRDRTDSTVEAPSFRVQLIAPLSAHAMAGEDPLISDTTAPSISWGVEAVGALNCPFKGTGVNVAVLDTGIDREHPAFAGLNILVKDFTGEGNGDENGHGTHCAGTICGRDVDGTRIGIAPGINKLLVGKVLGKKGGGATDAILDAIMWALENEAHVISMSLGMDFPGFQSDLVESGRPQEVATSIALQGYRENVRLFDRIAGLIEAGDFMGRRALVVAATGNESRRNVSSGFTIAAGPPAEADGFFSVGALQKTNNEERPYKVASFSNTRADIAAPGVAIWSARTGGGLQILSGTSMATPHVAGVAALWTEKSMKENDGDVLAEDILQNLRASAKTTPDLKREDVGKGLVQAPIQ